MLIEMIEDRDDARLPALARAALGSLVAQLRMTQAQILDLEKQLKAWHRSNEASRRLEAIPGVGVITATALVATIGDATQFHSGRQLAAWTHPGKVEAPYTVCIASASNLTGLVKSSVECRRTGL